MSPARRQPLQATRPAQEAQEVAIDLAAAQEARTPQGAPEAPQAEAATVRPMLTLSEAAKATGRNRRTMRRHLDSGKFPTAAQDDDGTWRIPIEDLLAAGLQLHASTPDTPPDDTGSGALWPAPGASPATTSPTGDRVAELERLLAAERTARAVAEAIAAERASQLDDLRGALEVLSRRELAPTDPTDDGAARRSWWRR